jgi:protein-S-isoprenylcysteine O-methyltransferase Ste14
MFAADRVQDLLRRLRDDVAAVVQSEIDLAKAEVTEKIKIHARAAALIAVAAAFVMLALLAFLFSAIAGLAHVVPFWASALIVGGVLVLIALLLAWLGMRAARKAGLPVPDEAIVEAKATVDELKKEAGTT